MSVARRSSTQQPSVRRRLATESLRAALLWLMGFAGAFVFIEPSPYEVVGAARPCSCSA